MTMPKKVFISGASKGIGKAIVLEFDRVGFEIVACSRSMNDLLLLGKEISNAGYHPLEADLTRDEDIEELIGFFETDGYPDIVVANMNKALPYRRLEDYEEPSEELKLVPMHLSHLLRMYRGCLLQQRKSHFGRWIAISSTVSALNGLEGMTFYLMQKRLLESLFDAIALEANDPGITANILLCGLVATDRVKEKRNFEALSAANLLRRSGQPVEIAQLVSFLADERAGFITGERIKIDGGATKSWYAKQTLKKNRT
jgi:3-oxoacyl-[acyl-carrier protein] reductase